MAWPPVAPNRWQKLRQLSWPERWLLVQVIVALPLTAVALRLVGLRWWQAVFLALSPKATGAEPGQKADIEERARRLAWLVEAVAGRYQPFVACLARSLVLWWVLRRQGIDSDLRIGVRKHAGRFEAHAWVECLGIVLNDTAEVGQRFAAFDRTLLNHP